MITVNAEKLAAIQLAEAKAARQGLVDAILVTVNGKEFNGDEIAQGRMARAAVAMEDTDQTLWVLADNTPTMVTKAELCEALRLAGEAQTAIWVAPYQTKESEEEDVETPSE